MPDHRVTLSDEEAAELYRFTLNDYISPKNYPALTLSLALFERQLKAKAHA
jgi:hypothetical protein